MAKRKSYRDRFFEDNELVQVPAATRKGYRMAYRYTGLFDAWQTGRAADSKADGAAGSDAAGGRSLLFYKRLFAAGEVVSVILYLVSASRNTGVNSARLASGFGMLSLIPWILELAGVVRFCVAGQYVKELTWEEIDRAIRYGTILRAILAAISCAAGLVQVLSAGMLKAADGIAAAGILVSAGISLLIFWRYRQFTVETYKNRDGRPVL